LAAGGRLWVFPALTAVVTTASGVAINVATDATASGLAWLVVAACTAAGAVLSALQLRRSGEPPDPDGARSEAISIDPVVLHPDQSSLDVFLSYFPFPDLAGPAALPGPSAESRSSSSRMTCSTALMRARCVNAWGKLPRCWPLFGSISSP
jgi:hypothetical protein